MGRNNTILKQIVAALFLAVPAEADEAELEALFEGLKGADTSAAMQIERRIFDIWSQSGSPSMDLLLTRGRDALEAGDTTLAIRHFTALIDHAPEFAEGYNGRATAYFQTGRLGLSLEDIRQVLILNPRHFSAMTGLALILEQLDRPEDALNAWRAVEELHPNREGLSDAITRLEQQVDGARL